MLEATIFHHFSKILSPRPFLEKIEYTCDEVVKVSITKIDMNTFKRLNKTTLNNAHMGQKKLFNGVYNKAITREDEAYLNMPQDYSQSEFELLNCINRMLDDLEVTK